MFNRNSKLEKRKPKKMRPEHTVSTVRPAMKPIYDFLICAKKKLHWLKEVKAILGKEYELKAQDKPGEKSSEDINSIYTKLDALIKASQNNCKICNQQISSVIMSPKEIVLTQLVESCFVLIEKTAAMLSNDIRELYNKFGTEKGEEIAAVVEECDIPFSVMKDSKTRFLVYLVSTAAVKEIVGVYFAEPGNICTYNKEMGDVEVDYLFTQSTRGTAGTITFKMIVEYRTYSSGSETLKKEVVVSPVSKVTIRTNDNQIGTFETKSIITRLTKDKPNKVSFAALANAAQLYLSSKIPRMQHMKASKKDAELPRDTERKAEDLKASDEIMTAIEMTKRYRSFKRDYFSISDFVELQRMFGDKYKDAKDKDGSPADPLKCERLDDKDITEFFNVIMSFVSTLKIPAVAHLWNMGYLLGFVSREYATKIAAKYKCSVIRLSLNLNGTWVITNSQGANIKIGKASLGHPETIAPIILSDTRFDDKFAYFEVNEENFTESDIEKKTGLSYVEKKDLFVDFLPEGSKPSQPKVEPGYLELS